MIKIFNAEELKADGILFRAQEENPNVEKSVKEILERVKKDGDRALKEYSEKFDSAALSSFEVTVGEIESAVKEAGDFIGILKEAEENIRLFHKKQKREGFSILNSSGATVGQRVMPLNKVGIYVPGGTASYPSTVLMNAVPAKIAGVKEIIMVTPPRRDGSVNPYILAAAHVAGVNRIFKIGGAQAVGALAYGTESVPAVDKIVGPGNIYVAAAKKQVFGAVDIDMVAGPSEILIIADETANPAFIAADLLSQAEHDVYASAILVTDSAEIADLVQKEVEKQLNVLPRKQIAADSLLRNGKIILVKTIAEAVKISNIIAPEHLELNVAEPYKVFAKIKNAGSVFLGHYTPEAAGDYFAGPNHTLPTGGTARFSSPLSVDDFVKKTQFICYDKEQLYGAGAKIARFAEAEGLNAHAEAIKIRFKGEEL